jgi:hypothetical protein
MTTVSNDNMIKDDSDSDYSKLSIQELVDQMMFHNQRYWYHEAAERGYDLAASNYHLMRKYFFQQLLEERGVYYE